MHYMAVFQERKKWKNAVYYEFYKHRPDKPLERARVTLTRCSSRQGDFDNLVSGFKAILDGLVMGKIILDDKVDVIGSPIFLWEKAKNKEGKIRIRVESV